jgi:flagellar hook-associated protein 3 FlgL
MRMTAKRLTEHVQATMTNCYSSLAYVEEQIATGKRILNTSDDPVGTAKLIQLKSQLAQENQYQSNINDGISFMNVTDTAMSSMYTAMQRVRELALEASSDTMSDSDREAAFEETDQLLREVVSLLNTDYNGSYVFGGSQSQIEPYSVETSDAGTVDDYSSLAMAYYDGSGGTGTAVQLKNAFDGSAIGDILPGTVSIKIGSTTYTEGTDYTVDYVNGTITPLNADLAIDVSDGGTFSGSNYTSGGVAITFEYVGEAKDIYGNTVSNTGDVSRTIENGNTVAINISGDDLTKNSDDGTDLIESLIKLEESLLNNDTDGIESGITNIDSAMECITSAQSKNGAMINRFESVLSRNESQITETTSLISDIEDVDTATAATDYSLKQTVYEAALKSAASILNLSLFDYL